MTARWAYRIPDASFMTAADSPRLARIRRAWPNLPDDPEQSWMLQDHPHGGVLMVWPRLDGSPVSLETFGEARETFDGLIYYPSKEVATREDLIRPDIERLQGCWLATIKGELYVAVALAAPREIILRVGRPIEYGKYANEYGLLGHDIYELFAKDGINEHDQRLARLLFLMEQQSYYRTEEMSEDDPWLTSADLTAVLHAIYGLNPKALAAAPAGSVS